MRIPRIPAFLIVVLIASSGGWLSAQAQRPPTTGTGFLAGQVVDTASGQPVADATITLGIARSSMTGTMMLTPSERQSVLTDAQGRFFFAQLPPGVYSPRVTKTGYTTLPGAVSRTADVGDGERVTDLKIKLSKLAIMSGSIRDDGGDPIVGTTMIALRRTITNGRLTMRPVGQALTDDRGAFRINGLPAGEYVVCACVRDPIPFDATLLTTLAADPLQLMGVAGRALSAGADVATLDASLRAFAPTYFPSSNTVARATIVTVGSGEEKTGVDLTLTATHATRVSGMVVGGISPMTAGEFRLVPAGETEDAYSFTQIPPMLVQPDGRFDFAGVTPGSYLLLVNHTVTSARGGGTPSGAALSFLGARGQQMGFAGVNQTPQDYPLWTAEPITVTDDGLRGISVSLRPGVLVKGRVQFLGASAQPTPQQISGLAVLLTPLVQQPGLGAIGRVTTDGTFQMQGATPGRYTFNATLVQKWTTLVSMTMGGIDVLDLPIDIGSSDMTDIVMTYSDAPLGTLAGSVSSGASSSADVNVLIFPTDRKYWVDPAAARRRFINAPISRNGTFSPLPLPAGEYFAVAVPDEQASEWQESTKLDTLSRGAQRVQVADSDKKTIEVKR